MKKLVALCTIALCILCTNSVNAKHAHRDCPCPSDELKPKYIELNRPEDVRCEPVCHLEKEREVICHDVEVCNPVCPVKKCHKEVRTVMVPREVCDTVCEYVCPAPKPECSKCHHRVCSCKGCHGCDRGKYEVVRAGEKRGYREERVVERKEYREKPVKKSSKKAVVKSSNYNN
jgi:hypothetical protein